MTFTLGMFVAAMIAGAAYWIGHRAARKARADAISFLAPTTPASLMTGKQIADAVCAELDRKKNAQFGLGGTRGQALEGM
jgi:hypothetical protein